MAVFEMCYETSPGIRGRYLEVCTMGDLIKAVEDNGGHFFEPATKRFFRSRILDDLYIGTGGCFFVTSEQFAPSRGPAAKRRYTVRQFRADCSIDTHGEFQAYATPAAAKRAARNAADGVQS